MAKMTIADWNAKMNAAMGCFSKNIKADRDEIQLLYDIDQDDLDGSETTGSEYEEYELLIERAAEIIFEGGADE